MTEKSALEDQLYQKQIDEEDLRQEMQSLQDEKERLQKALQSSREESEKVVWHLLKGLTASDEIAFLWRLCREPQ